MKYFVKCSFEMNPFPESFRYTLLPVLKYQKLFQLNARLLKRLLTSIWQNDAILKGRSR